MRTISLSNLSHTWLIDIDGTILKHNGHINGNEELLPGVLDFWSSIPQNDLIILLTARKSSDAYDTVKFLKNHCLRFDHIIYDTPVGERILINDIKPSGLITALAVNLSRNSGFSDLNFTSDL